MTTRKQHPFWMKRALDLAEKGRFRTSPNPMVGACVVKGNRLVSEGYHREFGGDHAEVIALKKAGKRAKGAVLYVTLEPCATWAKTPPCAQAVRDSGIRQVVIGSLDPNPANHGKGVRELKDSGIRVLTGVGKKEVQKQNAAFFKFIRTRLPFVTVKMAQSLDGKIATVTGNSRWISSPASRRWVHRLRAEHDAILVGTNTLLKDDPFLSPREGLKRSSSGKPWRVVLDPRHEVSPRARVFRGKQITMLAVSGKKMKGLSSVRKNGKRGVFLSVKERKGKLDAKDLLRQLGSLGVCKLLVEGGGELVWSLFEAGLVDRYLAVISPKIIGGRNAKTAVEGAGVRLPSQGFTFKEQSLQRFGEDWLFEGSR